MKRVDAVGSQVDSRKITMGRTKFGTATRFAEHREIGRPAQPGPGSYNCQ
jgi:hypothetical protein